MNNLKPFDLEAAKAEKSVQTRDGKNVKLFFKHGLTFFPLEGISREKWLEMRKDGIGGSDMSSILGLNHRFSAVELFYQKVGMTQNNTDENEAIFWGNQNESVLLPIGQYYDFDTAQYIDNYNSDRKLRKITKMKYMIRNDAYPWILANLDSVCNFRPRNFTMDNIVEAKTISRQTADMWENRIPPYHIVQILTYATVCRPMTKLDSAMIFYLEDGRVFRGYHIPMIESIKDQILTRSEAFWKTVLKGREIMADIKDNDTRLKYLAQIEPDPDNSEAYYQFLSELFKLKSSFVRIDATHDDAVNAIAYKRLSREMNSIDEQRQEFKNKIMKSLHDAGANIIDFGDGGKITYNKKLYVNIKEELLETQES